MKCSLIACAVTGALAVNTNLLAARDGAAVVSILSDVKSKIEALQSSVKSYSGDQAPLLKASNNLITTLKDGKTKVDASDELTLNEAVELTQPAQALTKSGESLTSDLKAFRPTVEKAGECVLFRTQVGSVNDASQALIKSVIGKVPQEAQSIASQLVDGLTQVLDSSVSDFSADNCKDSGSSSSGTSSAADGESASVSASVSAAVSASASHSSASSASSATAATSVAAITVASTAAATGAATTTTSTVSTGVPVVAGAGAIAPLGAAALFAVAGLLL